MKGIIIGAGRGARLMPYTESCPKCYTEIDGERLLDRTIAALRSAGVDEIVFIGGYLIDAVRADYPQLTFCENDDWPNNNIMQSLMYAESHMERGFVCAYSDILFSPAIAARLMESPHDITLACDTRWRDRYLHRSEHPETDAEKVAAEGERLVRVDRDLPSDQADAEYIGLARFSPRGAELLRQHYRAARERYAPSGFQGARSFDKAYLIHLLQEMIERGVTMHMLPTAGGYIEIDTTEDYRYAQQNWSAAESGQGS